MDQQLIDLASLLIIINSDPVFSQVLDCFPAMILTTIGSITELLTGNQAITPRQIIGGIALGLSMGIVANALMTYLEVKPVYIAASCLSFGYMSSKRWILDGLVKVIATQVTEKIKRIIK